MNTTLDRGDLVMVIRPRFCGCKPESMGLIFSIGAIWTDVENIHCPECGAACPETTFVWTEGMHKCCEISRVKRIPPLSEEERQVEEAVA